MTADGERTASGAERAVRPRPAQWAALLGLGLGGAVASALPVTGVMVWSGDFGQAWSHFLAVVVVGMGLLVAVPLLLAASHGVRRAWHRELRPVLGLVLPADLVVTLLLTGLLPFRWGALSCLMYCLPALCVAWGAVLRSRAAALAALAGLFLVYAVAPPVREVQRHVAAEQWLKAEGVPSRALAQVVDLPGLRQEPYRWDGKTLTAMFDFPVGESDAWLGAEEVAPGDTDPCGPLLTGEGDGAGTVSPPCVQEAPGLWFRGSRDDAVGYVLRRDGVTISLTGGAWAGGDGSATSDAEVRRAGLRKAILAAHPASDAELWSREGPTPPTLPARLLL